jgi:Protein of unknown function (DUF4239)
MSPQQAEGKTVMTSLLSHIPTVGLLVLLMILGSLPPFLTLWLVRRRYTIEVLKDNHDVAGYTLNVIGVLYAVLVAFVLLAAWEQFRRTEEICEIEGAVVRNLHRDSFMLPAASQVPVRQALIDYAAAVTKKEWPSLIIHSDHPAATAAMNHIWQAYYSVQATTDAEKVWYGESVAKLNELAAQRRLRIIQCRQHVSWVMWVLLVMGGVITVGFMNFFGVQSFRSHLIMTVSLTSMLILILFIIYALDHPFWGDLRITPQALSGFLELHPVP